MDLETSVELINDKKIKNRKWWINKSIFNYATCWLSDTLLTLNITSFLAANTDHFQGTCAQSYLKLSNMLLLLLLALVSHRFYLESKEQVSK